MDETRVMVVDDEQVVCDRLKEHLEKNDFRVTTFTDSRQALDALEEGRYHVVVTDLKMRGSPAWTSSTTSGSEASPPR